MVDRSDVSSSPFKPGGLFVNPDGTLTGEAYRYLDQIWQRTGGFVDQVNAVDLLASSVEALSLIRRDLEAQRQDIEALRAGVDTALTRKILRGDINPDQVFNKALARRAATTTGFSASNSFGPYSMDRFADTVFSDFESAVAVKGTNDSPGRELLSVEVTIEDASPGDPLLVWFDGQLNYRGGIAQFVCWHEKCWIMDASATFKNDYFGASTPRSTSDDDYLTVNDASRGMTRLFNRVQERPTEDLGSNISTEANNSNQILSIPLSGMTVTAAPSDIESNPYKIVFAFALDREQVSYQNGNNNGWKNANSATLDWSIEDLDLVVMNLKEKQ